MAFYSSKCIHCTERSKRIVKETKYKDENGTYKVRYYECENYACDVAHKAIRTNKAKKDKSLTYQAKEK